MKGYSFGELVKLAEAALPKTDNAVSATKLLNIRKIAGQNFNGTQDVHIGPTDVGAAPTVHGHTPAEVGLPNLIDGPQTYGNLMVKGAKEGVQGISFDSRLFSVLDGNGVGGKSGIFDFSLSRYLWSFGADGRMSEGSIPWANVVDKPETATRWPTPAEVGTTKVHASLDFGANADHVTTQRFVQLLEELGAFATGHWVARGSWSYGDNWTINDCPHGLISLAGAVVEVTGLSYAYTIKITTPTTTNGGVANAEFIYVNNGAEYHPAWRRLYNTTFSPSYLSTGFGHRMDWANAGASQLSNEGAVVSQLGWNNFGNGHTIFDASKSASPNGLFVDQTNADHHWTAGYPTLMGWNGERSYGVRVDACRWADGASNSHELNGTWKTAGQDLNVHGKRALVGDNNADQLVLNYGGDFRQGTVNQGAFFSTWFIHSDGMVRGRTTGPIYETCGLETYVPHGSTDIPKISFHKAGHWAGMLDMRNENTFAFVTGDAQQFCNLHVKQLLPKVVGYTGTLQELQPWQAAINLETTVSPQGVNYIPIIGGTNQIENYGYNNHFSMGWNRSAGGFGGVYIATGGSDYNPTVAFNFGSDGALSVPGRVNCGDILSTGWIRTLGDTGWHSETYGGGLYMIDSVWVRTYGGKQFFVDNGNPDAIQTTGGVKTGGDVTCGRNVGVTGDVYAKAFYGNANVDGTGQAVHCPGGIYSKGHNWLYGPVETAGHMINTGSGSILCGNVTSSGRVTGAEFTGNGSGLTNIPRNAVIYRHKTLYDNVAGHNTGNFVLSAPWYNYNELVFITGSDDGVYRYSVRKLKYEIEVLQGSGKPWNLCADAYNFWNGSFASDGVTFVTNKENCLLYGVIGFY